MEKHFNLSDIEFKKQFLKCELSPADFTHEAHLRLAWLFIDKYGIRNAENKIQSSLKKFVEFSRAKDKYNVTLTVAATKAVHHFKSKI